MTCVAPSLATGDDIELGGQQVHDLAFSFVAPLGTYRDQSIHACTTMILNPQNYTPPPIVNLFGAPNNRNLKRKAESRNGRFGWPAEDYGREQKSSC